MVDGPCSTAPAGTPESPPPRRRRGPGPRRRTYQAVLSQGADTLQVMLCGLDLDGVLCDLGPSVADRIATASAWPATRPPGAPTTCACCAWACPRTASRAFLDETFADPGLYSAAPVCDGVRAALRQLRESGWDLVGITARPPHLAAATRAWLARHGLPVEEVHHTPVGTKSAVARRLGADATIEDNPAEAELLAEVCDSWLLDRPYNQGSPVVRARRLLVVGRRRRPALPAPALRLSGHFAVTAVGADRPGIVAAVTGASSSTAATWRTRSMTILRGHFAMMLVVDAPGRRRRRRAGGGARRPGGRSRPGRHRPRRPTSRRRPSPTSSRGPSSVYGADRPGIVHGVAGAAGRARGEHRRPDHPGDRHARDPVYAMVLEVTLPPDGDPHQLQADLEAKAGELGVTCRLHPSEADIL